MFISKRNNIVYPQSEHLKFSAVLAAHWGNELFSKPPIPHASFVKAVADHDNGYGHYDASAVGLQNEEGLLKLWKRCVDQVFEDPYVEIVIKRHFMRLASIYTTFPGLVDFYRALSEDVSNLYRTNGFDQHMFDVTDTIMQACDAISFSFCQEETSRWELEVYTNASTDEKTTITYSIDEKHTVSIDPYPLDDAHISEVLTAYDKTDYPRVLLPSEIHYQIMKRL